MPSLGAPASLREVREKTPSVFLGARLCSAPRGTSRSKVDRVAKLYLRREFGDHLVMTAAAVIEEIKHLPPAEQSRVIRFAFELARERQMSGDKLSGLAEKMRDSQDPADVAKLREEIHRGFYGE